MSTNASPVTVNAVTSASTLQGPIFVDVILAFSWIPMDELVQITMNACRTTMAANISAIISMEAFSVRAMLDMH